MAAKFQFLLNDDTMKSKPVIAILADFPYWVINPAISRPPGHYAVWLVALYEALKTVSDYEIHWICFSKGLKRYQETLHDNQVFHILPAGSLELASRVGYWWDKVRVKRLLRRLKPDLVHAWGTENRYAACGACFSGLKILSVQGVMTVCCRRSKMNSFAKRQAALEAALMPRYDLVTVESGWCKDRCREISPASHVVEMEYAVEERFFETERSLADSPTCLLVCSDTPLKNVATAIKGFSSPRLSAITLLMAGIPAEKYPDLPPNIQALGRVSREKVAQLLSSSWALVHPSLADTGPTVVKEARVSGVAVVATTECGSAQYVEQGKSGFVIAPCDVEALQNAVLTIAQSAEQAQRMGTYGQTECRRALSRETMVNRLREIYDAMLHGRSSQL